MAVENIVIATKYIYRANMYLCMYAIVLSLTAARVVCVSGIFHGG